MHSPVLSTMLQLEHTYAQAIQERTKARDRQKFLLEERQTDEMNNAVENLNITQDERSINDLVSKHFDDISLLEAEWSSELDTMKEVNIFFNVNSIIFNSITVYHDFFYCLKNLN